MPEARAPSVNVPSPLFQSSLSSDGRRDVEVGVAVAVEVGRRHSRCRALRDRRRSALLTFTKLPCTLWKSALRGRPPCVVPGADVRVGVRVDDEQVDPAVVVVVEPAEPAAHHRRRVGGSTPKRKAPCRKSSPTCYATSVRRTPAKPASRAAALDAARRPAAGRALRAGAGRSIRAPDAARAARSNVPREARRLAPHDRRRRILVGGRAALPRQSSDDDRRRLALCPARAARACARPA